VEQRQPSALDGVCHDDPKLTMIRRRTNYSIVVFESSWLLREKPAAVGEGPWDGRKICVHLRNRSVPDLITSGREFP